jgi:tellurite resistance protein
MTFPPLGLFGAVMGLVGLGLAARAAAPLFPGLFRAPAYFSEPWIAAGALLFVVLGLLYFLKVVTGRAKEDFVVPERMGALGLVPVGMMLIAAGMAPYQPELASLLWWKAIVLYALGLAWGLARLFQLGLATPRLTPAWIVLFVGGIVSPAAGIPLGHEAASKWVFCIGLAAGLLLVVPLAKRPRLPEPGRPSWFILLAPPALIAVHGGALFRHPALVVALWIAVGVLAILLYRARSLLRVPYSETLWAITFPLDAFALAAARQALAEQSHFWRGVAGFALVLAILAVLFCVFRFLRRGDARVQ